MRCHRAGWKYSFLCSTSTSSLVSLPYGLLMFTFCLLWKASLRGISIGTLQQSFDPFVVLILGQYVIRDWYAFRVQYHTFSTQKVQSKLDTSLMLPLRGRPSGWCYSANHFECVARTTLCIGRIKDHMTSLFNVVSALQRPKNRRQDEYTNCCNVRI